MRFSQRVLFVTFFIFFTIINTCSMASECATCHGITTQQWTNSVHAHAASNAWFQLLSAKSEIPDNDCNACHNPMYSRSMSLQIHSEQMSGIHCDFCHAFILETDNGTLQYVPVEGKTGPIKDKFIKKAGHECIYETNLKKSEFCTSCHGRASAIHGSAFSNVEQEWQNSPYDEMDIHCQDCHMPWNKTPKDKAQPYLLTNHSYPGSSLLGMLRSCITMQTKVQNSGKNVIITVDLVNDRAGHAIPTASPFRMIVLTIEGQNKAGKTLWKNYRYDPIKESPKTVFAHLPDYAAFQVPTLPLDETQANDTRLYPHQKQTVQFSAPAGEIGSIHISLDYYHMPPRLAKSLKLGQQSLPINIASTDIKI